MTVSTATGLYSYYHVWNNVQFLQTILSVQKTKLR